MNDNNYNDVNTVKLSLNRYDELIDIEKKFNANTKKFVLENLKIIDVYNSDYYTYHYKNPDSKIVADVILMDDSDAFVKINELIVKNKELSIEIDRLHTEISEINNNKKSSFFSKL